MEQLERLGSATAVVAPRKLSYEIWGIEWERHLPVQVAGNAQRTIELGDPAECLDLLSRNSEAIFDLTPDDRRFGHSGSDRARRRFYEQAADFFAFRDAGRLVGFFVGNPIDWDSYYMRHICVLPESRGCGWMEATGVFLLPVLAEYGVSIVESHTSPSNFISQHYAAKFGVFPVGSVCTTRWGTLIHYMGFLNSEAKETFRRQFCSGIQPESRVRQP